MPNEVLLTDEEQEELHTAAMGAMKRLGLSGDDGESVVRAIEQRIAERRGKKERDERIFELGALYALCLAEALSWELLHLEWEGLEALAVCEMDRSVVVLPLLAVATLFDDRDAESQLLTTFTRLEEGQRPPGTSRGDYAVLLP